MRTYTLFFLPIFIALFFCVNITVLAQCTNCGSQWPSGTVAATTATSAAPETISTNMWGGDFAVCSVISGVTYTWSTCGDTDFDTELTLYVGGTCSGSSLAYNDDDCGTQSTITWTATFTGTVQVLLTEYDWLWGDCLTNSTSMTLTWYSGTGGGATTAGDCIDALNVCTDLGFQVDANGYGSINEIPALGTIGNPNNNNPGGSGNAGCLMSAIPENNSTWMIINIGSTGSLQFNFGGSSQAGYYDWIMYPYDDAQTCSQVPTGNLAPVRCNWNGSSSGGTGLASTIPAGGSASNFEPPLSVTCGDKYIICFSNYSSAVTNVPLVFSGTASVACAELTCAGNAACSSAYGDPIYQNCVNAIPVCQDYFCQVSAFSGVGSITGEISSSNSCLASGEKNDVWYTFSVLQSGNLNFDITPNDLSDDYDWAVYNLTSANCSDIATNASLEVSCNYSGTSGVTGPDGGSGSSSQSAGGTPLNAVIPVVIGQTYVLNVSNFSSTQSGYELDFSASTAVIYDNIPPAISSLVTTPSCGSSQITFNFSENVLCSTVQNCDFTLTGPGSPYTLSGVSGAGCALGSQENTFTINVSPAITTPGNYNLNLVAGCGYVEDLCGNVATIGSLPFTITGMTVAITGSVNPTCPLACNGTATATVTNGSPNYTYSWSNGSNATTASTSNTATGLCGVPGIYTLTVTDAGGVCSATTSVTVTDPSAMVLTLTPSNATCGSTDGSILAQVSGGASLYDYTSVPASTNGMNQGTSYTFPNLGINTYFVTVTDNNGCTIEGSTTVNGGGSVLAGFTYFQNQCFTGSNTVNFTNTSTATGAMTYEWDFDGNGSIDNTTTNPSFTYTSPGIYDVTLTAIMSGCSDPETMQVTIYDLPTVAFTPSDATCNGGCDGTLLAIPSAGGPAGSSTFISYAWSNGGNASLTTGLCAATPYTVTVTDNLGCTVTGSSTVGQAAPMVISPATTDLKCFGVCSGGAQVVSVAGGSGLFYYLWSNGGTTESIDNLCAGNYNVIVTDQNSLTCTVSEPYIVSQPDIITLTTSNTPSTCGQSDGSATVNVTSTANPNYTYNWCWNLCSQTYIDTIASPTGTVAGVPAGPVLVTVTDDDGCTATASVNISDLAGPTSAIIDSTMILCNGQCTGEATVEVTGGVPPYTYTWDGVAGAPTAATTDQATGLCQGIHAVSILDVGGCATSASVLITEPLALSTLTTGVDANCSTPGSAATTPTGGSPGYTYLWTGGATTSGITNLIVGTYLVTVTDTKGCSVISSVDIGDIGSLGASITNSSPPLCNGGSNGSSEVTVSGGLANYSYTWDSGIPFISALTTNTISTLNAGVHSVTITDANQCSAITSVTITDPSPVIATMTDSSDMTCYGGSDGTATVAGSGGAGTYSYLWDVSAADQTTAQASILVPGTYTVTVSDIYGCTATASVTLGEPTQVAATTASIAAHCGQSDGIAFVATVTGGTVTTGYTYSWSSGTPGGSTDTTTNISSAGSPYIVTVTDNNNCTATSSVSVSDVAGVSASISSFQNVSCLGGNNGQATVSGAGGNLPYAYLWNALAVSQTTATAISLAATTYSVTITDANSCSSSTTVTIGAPTVVVPNLSNSNPDCFNDPANMSANPSGGTGPYTFQWNDTDNSITQSVLGVAPSTYWCTVTDDNGCTAAQSVSIVNPVQIQLLVALVENASCNQNDGGVAITVTAAGSDVLTFTWSNSTTNEDLDSVVAGNYTVTITNQKGCSLSQLFTVPNDNGPIAIIDSVIHASCYGICDGVAYASATGGAGILKFSWNTPAITGQVAPGLCAGPHTVTVEDTNHCTSVATALVLKPEYLNFNIFAQEPKCWGNTDGSIAIFTFGGTEPYSYLWSSSGSGTNDTLIGVGAGVYFLEVKDAKGCDTIETIVLSQPDPIVVLPGSNPSKCYNTNDGQAYIETIYGGTPDPDNGYYALWDSNTTNQTTDTAYFLLGGQYCVTVSDDYQCTQTTCVTVNSPDEIVLDNLVFTDLNCYQDNGGSISVTVSGGDYDFDFGWTNSLNTFSSTNQNLVGLAAGNYFLTVTDGNNCTLVVNQIISQPPPLNVLLDTIAVQCYGECNGGIISTIPNNASGQPPYSYLWINNQTDATAINLCKGVYSVTVTDDAGCTASASAAIEEPALLKIIQVIDSSASCGVSNGYAAVIHNGGTVGYSVLWSDGTPTFYNNDLAAGTYTVTISDIFGCQTDTVVNINNLGGPIIDSIVTTDVTCKGFANGSAIVYFTESFPPAAPYTISWNAGTYSGSSIIGLNGGTYSVKITDTVGCQANGSVSISEPPLLTAMISSHTNANCYGVCNGIATVQSNGGVPGGYSYFWSSASTTQTASGLCAGNNQVVVSDLNGCTANAGVFITEPNEINISATVVDATCSGANNGIITAFATGGSSNFGFFWPAIPAFTSTISSLSPDYYTVVVSDLLAPSCQVSTSYGVSEPEPIQFNITNTPSSCDAANGSAEIVNITGGSGSYSILWSPYSTTNSVSGLIHSIDYIVQVADLADNTCKVTQYFQIDRIIPPLVQIFDTDSTRCNGTSDGKIALRVKDGTRDFTYAWFPVVAGSTDTVAIGLTAGTYYVTITDADGCTSSAYGKVYQPNPIHVYGTGNPAICPGQSVVISAVLSGGSYPFTYFWQGGTITENTAYILVTPSITTAYGVNVFDALGCSSENTATITVVIYEPLMPTAWAVDPIICNGEQTDLMASVGSSHGTPNYFWSSGSAGVPVTVSPTTDSTFFVTVTDDCPTMDTLPVYVQVNPKPIIAMLATPMTGCEPLTVQFNNLVTETNVTYLWDFGDPASLTNTASLQAPVHVFENDGNYNVKLTCRFTTTGCVNSYLYDDMIEVYPRPTAVFLPVDYVTGAFESEVSFFDNSYGAVINLWYWQFGDAGYSYEQNPVYEYNAHGIYTVNLEVTSNFGCIDSTNGQVQILEESTFYVPDAFRPGSGGEIVTIIEGNKYFYPKGTGVSRLPGNYLFIIYDRWGEIIFETTTFYDEYTGEGLEGRWDGKAKNNRYVETGVYTYYILYKDVQGNEYPLAGSVTVIR